MRTKIYQINSKRDVNRVKFEGLELLERYQGFSAVDPSIYDEVFSAEIDETDLEQIFVDAKIAKQKLFRSIAIIKRRCGKDSELVPCRFVDTNCAFFVIVV